MNKKDELQKYSDFDAVNKKAKKLLGVGVEVSTRKDKKYMIRTPEGKLVHFGGDHRISPDNDFEVKGLTNDDNVNGESVKVVLITQAGSEGLDFKGINYGEPKIGPNMGTLFVVRISS